MVIDPAVYEKLWGFNTVLFLNEGPQEITEYFLIIKCWQVGNYDVRRILRNRALWCKDYLLD